APALPHLFGLPIGHADLMRLIESLLFGVIAVLALVLVLRPMMLRLSTIATAGPALSPHGAAGGVLWAIAGPQSAVPQSALAALPAPQRGAEDERLIEIANVEGQLRASSIRRIADMVEKHPDESLSIVRSWMLQEGG
ncbi:MAG TPA: flagellar M-ring protein FliF, partial [Acetobacteraceae bacterium]|nr:flagellar M-ring protein FliF [Acetobacteraceae bacterium]